MQLRPRMFVIVRVKLLVRIQAIHVTSHFVYLFITKLSRNSSGTDLLLKLKNLLVDFLAAQFARRTFDGEIFVKCKKTTNNNP